MASMDAESRAAEEPTADKEPSPSIVPPSSSALSDVPNTDSEKADAQPGATRDKVPPTAPLHLHHFSPQTEELVNRINANAANAAKAGTPGYDAAKEQIMRDMATSDSLSVAPPSTSNALNGDWRRDNGATPANGTPHNDSPGLVKIENGTPSGASGRGRGRGRGGGRPRGKSRGAGRTGKRKREDGEEDSDSDEVTPIATMTKSGRSVNKPTTFVPPPPPSPTVIKRKRTYSRNPQSAVCKACLRGTSPAGNMIVFCDGCNTPYHRYCHHPTIDQAVIDEVEREWYCRSCERARVLPVPDSEVADFVSVPGASIEERKRYFSSLPPGVCATLLTKATTLHPDLPVFAPDFGARTGPRTEILPSRADMSAVANGNSHHPPAPIDIPPPQPQPRSTPALPQPANSPHVPVDLESDNEMAPYGDQHPVNYPRPGHGLMKTLPPEQDDLGHLVDDGHNSAAFQHLYQSDPVAANASANASNGQISR